MEKNDINNEAIKLYKELTEQIDIAFHDMDYSIRLRITRFVADRMKAITPMYLGAINPKWLIYDRLIEITEDKMANSNPTRSGQKLKDDGL